MLKELIDQYYSDKGKSKEQMRFYITDAGKCGRATFFKFKNAPRREMEARVLRMFDHGDYIHQLIMKSLFGIYQVRVVAAEVDMPPQEMISGRADAIISLNNEVYVLDIKSMNSMVFKNLTCPKEENIYQIQLYLHYFQVKKGILLYVDKDQQELKEFFIDYDPELCNKLLEDFKKLKEKIETNVVPMTLVDYPQNWQCSYCQFREICDIVGKEEVSWLEFKEKMRQKERT